MAKLKAFFTIKLEKYATDIFDANDFEYLVGSKLGDVDTYVKEIAEYQPDAIYCRVEPVTAEMMAASRNLKVVGKQGAGLDNIDMEYARTHNIQVVYAPAGNANAVAEHGLLLMLACSKRYTYVDRQFRAGNYGVRMNMPGTYELKGRTLGVIGCGRISTLLQQKCKYGMDMKVIGYDPYIDPAKVGDLCELKKTAEEVWSEADYVSIHLPLIDSTAYSVGRAQFSLMKPESVFINVARGALVKEDELIECLKDGTLYMAGLDVFDQEPIKPESKELYELDNVVITPHTAASTRQSVINCCTIVANDIVAVCNGRKPEWPACQPKF